MIDWLFKILRVPSWSVTGVLREKQGLLEFKNRELEAKLLISQAENKELKARNQELENKDKESQSQVAVLKQQVENLTEQVDKLSQAQSYFELDEPKRQILSTLESQGPLYMVQLVGVLELPQSHCEYHVEELIRARYINPTTPRHGPRKYSLAHKGKEVFVKEPPTS